MSGKTSGKWTLTTTRHHDALVFAVSVMRHQPGRYSAARGFTVTLGLGLWSFHLAYRSAARHAYLFAHDGAEGIVWTDNVIRYGKAAAVWERPKP